jgi:hypothetical protein
VENPLFWGSKRGFFKERGARQIFCRDVVKFFSGCGEIFLGARRNFSRGGNFHLSGRGRFFRERG